MRGDFTRTTFDPHKHFARVLMQQGRVQLDSDFNEQASILLHYIQTLAADLIGPHGGPGPEPGFKITPDDYSRVTELTIGPGRYYVDGILCENPRESDDEGNEVYVTYLGQPNRPLPEEDDIDLESPLLVYLDVWERHLTAIEEPGIREVALGGPDTSTRSKVVWQVRATNTMPDGSRIPGKISRDDLDDSRWREEWVESWQPAYRGRLKARGKEALDEDACITSPEARYRGTENQLYRVEVHYPGLAAGQEDRGDVVRRERSSDYERTSEANSGVATFKWSRDNGSVVFPIRDLQGETVILDHLGRDDRLGLQIGDRVEIVDDDHVLQGRAEALPRVEEIDIAGMRVTLSEAPSSAVGQDPARHPLLRRWDHGGTGPERNGESGLEGGTLPLREDAWLTLEDGVQICFEPAPNGRQNVYRTGDYWLIPARTATGDVEWPGEVGHPEARPPDGVEHHYAPLASVANGDVEDYRCGFTLPRQCPPLPDNW